MLKLLKTLRKILRPKNVNLTGEDGLVHRIRDNISSKLGTVIGMLERAHEVLLFIPVIYKVARWDNTSLFTILSHWLSRMEEVHRNDPHHANNLTRAKELKICSELASRIAENKYEDKLFDEYNKRWGEPVFTMVDSDTNPGYKQLNISRPNAVTEDQKEQAHKEFVAMSRKAAEIYYQDLDMLFTIIKKKHRSWWV